ncbi:MAG: lysophospholipid acyltransferase family protein [Nitrospirota bacterium]
MKKGRQKALPYNTIARALITPFLLGVKYFPLWFCRFLSWVITCAYYPFFIKRRHDYQDNLKHILGDGISDWRLFSITFRMCVNYGYYLVDLFRVNDRREEELQEMLSGESGYENIQDALSRGKGGILLTAHMGNWELGGIVLSRLGHAVNVVYFPDSSRRIERNRTKKRLMRGVKEIRLDPERISPLAMMRALERGELVALQGDKLYHDSGTKVRFFDAPAYFPRGPVLLAMMTGAPILPSFIIMDGKAKYKIIVENPIYAVKTGDRERDIEENLKKVAEIFEKYIGMHYDQWYCFTRFWDSSTEKSNESI